MRSIILLRSFKKIKEASAGKSMIHDARYRIHDIKHPESSIVPLVSYIVDRASCIMHRVKR
ncbi:MAG: hypothetical protein FJ242_07170 [Nitrospira sp.]|nr:hypothetical protein [Nitrospira sp.]